jgi:membrane protease subunit (stomatin/prohibitin family)
MAILDLIQHPNQPADEVVRRIPENSAGEFRLGSQLVVREDQRALFMRDGKALDVFGPGRHTLSTNNIPLLGRLIGAPFGGNSPFTAEVFFVSMREFTSMKWGTLQPMVYRDRDFGMVRLRAFGGYSFKVAEPALLVGNLAGSRGVFSLAQLDDYLKGVIINEFNDVLGKTMTSLLDLAGMTRSIADSMQALLQDDFQRLGLTLLTFQVGAITAPEEVQKRIDERSGMGAVGDMGQYMQYQAAQAIGEIARNPGGTGDIAATGVGLGAGVALGQAMAQAMQGATAGAAKPAAAPAAAGTVPCGKCGTGNPAGAKFCNSCGEKLGNGGNFCTDCGTQNAPGAKFCGNCGKALGV